ncbi:MAG: hypothetical protein FJW21_03320 [Acidimicrobiia bacterium]|nr:hypothetical protein [Acidimicrobiia bacterium]
MAIEDVYSRYELLDPATSTLRITEDVSVTTAGARIHVERLSPGGQLSDVTAIDRMTGQPLKYEVVEGELRVQLARPVPKGGETRLRIVKTSREPRAYGATGTEIEFQRALDAARNAIVLPAGYEVLSANVPSQVIEEADGRLTLSHWQTGPTAPWITLRARLRPVPSDAAKAPPVTSPVVMTPGTAATAPRNELANLRITERAIQDREIVYFLQQPETHSFRLYHDYTESRPGVATYRNVVRGGSSVSDPSAVLLDTGESLRVETVKEGDAVVVIIHFPAVQAGRSSRLRITETYTDPGRYGLVDGQLVWNRNFGRPANDVVLPEGWYLTDSAIPGVISTEPDGRTRVAFINPRPDSIDVVLKARRR